MASEDPASLFCAVGHRIAELRRAANLTQEEMASRLGTALRNYQDIEHGKRNLTLRTMARIASILGVKTINLLEDPASSSVRMGRPRKSGDTPTLTPKRARSPRR